MTKREQVRKCEVPECPNPGVVEQSNGDVLCPDHDPGSMILKYAMERETR